MVRPLETWVGQVCGCVTRVSIYQSIKNPKSCIFAILGDMAHYNLDSLIWHATSGGGGEKNILGLVSKWDHSS